jgi:hypothetical protein
MGRAVPFGLVQYTATEIASDAARADVSVVGIVTDDDVVSEDAVVIVEDVVATADVVVESVAESSFELHAATSATSAPTTNAKRRKGVRAMAWSRLATTVAPFRPPSGCSLLNGQLSDGFAEIERVDTTVVTQPSDEVHAHPSQRDRRRRE